MNTLAAARVTQRPGLVLLICALTSTTLTQQPQKQAPIIGDFIIRHEWNDNFFVKPDPVPANRTRFQVRPRFEVETDSLRMGLGADIIYSRDNNLEPKDVPLPLALIRDNYDSRSIRLDLAYLGINLGGVKVNAGRMAMPFRVTDMIWDKDLRIQGGSAVWVLHQGGTGEPTARASGIYSRGGHVFGDSEDVGGASLGKGVTITGGSLDLGFGSGKRVDVSATYLKFDKLEHLERKIRRQNTRVAGGPPVREFGVIDLALRFRTDAPFPMQVVLDGARNHKAPNQRNGLWAALVLGSLIDGRFRGEYTYASMDKDVTVAAYAGDDFFWGTGWLGHRAEFAFAQSPKSSFHVIGQMQQFKDAPNVAERTNWLRRLRLEVRRTF